MCGIIVFNSVPHFLVGRESYVMSRKTNVKKMKFRPPKFTKFCDFCDFWGEGGERFFLKKKN